MYCDAPYLFSIFLLMAVLFTDIKWHRIPNWITIPALVGGICYHLSHTGSSQGFVFAFEGLLAGACLLLLPFLLGGMGGGDVKLFAALGSWLGAQNVFQIFIYTALFGGCISIGMMLYKRRWVGIMSVWEDFRSMIYAGFISPKKSDSITFAYSIPVLMGFVVFCWAG